MRSVNDRIFERQYKKLPVVLQDKMWERLSLLIANEFSPLLDNHKLHHPYHGYSSINITGDIRLVYKKIGTEIYYLRAIGTHHQLYGK